MAAPAPYRPGEWPEGAAPTLAPAPPLRLPPPEVGRVLGSVVTASSRARAAREPPAVPTLHVTLILKVKGHAALKAAAGTDPWGASCILLFYT